MKRERNGLEQTFLGTQNHKINTVNNMNKTTTIKDKILDKILLLLEKKNKAWEIEHLAKAYNKLGR